jgi:hypothetical protein
MIRDELVEIALETFFCSLEDYSWPHAVDDPMHRLRHQVSSAVAVVLEEAAKVAENKANKLAQYRDVHSMLQVATAEDIADEIRQLKGDK